MFGFAASHGYMEFSSDLYLKTKKKFRNALSVIHSTVI